MNIRNYVFVLAITFVSSAMSNQKINFSRQLQDGTRATFSCDWYSTKKEGLGKIIWYPASACWIDSSLASRTAKVWAIMPLQRVEKNECMPIWHCSQKPKSHIREPSTKYQVHFYGAMAEADTAMATSYENVFDIDAGDLFPWFGRSESNIMTYFLGGQSSAQTHCGDSILCSAGRIGIDHGRVILMYGLTAFQNGECLFNFSVNGLGDSVVYSFTVKDGRLYASNGRQFGDMPIVHSSYPALSVWVSAADTVNMRISYDSKELMDPVPTDDDICFSASNLIDIVDWLGKQSDTRGAWQSMGKCSLKSRRIF